MTKIITIIFLAVAIWLFASAIGNAIAMIVIHANKRIRRLIRSKRGAR